MQNCKKERIEKSMNETTTTAEVQQDVGFVCVYERTLFYNAEQKYCVIRVKTSNPTIPMQARNPHPYRDNMFRFVAVGYELPLTDKISMELRGVWKKDNYGYQLHVTQCIEIIPQTLEGIQAYLSSRLIKGVGKKTASMIVERFGMDALQILENEPDKLLEIKGITPEKLKEIQYSYGESRCLRDIMMLLSPYQITPTTATKIYEHFGAKSVEILKDNPFELCQIPGFGFKRVDDLLQKNGFPSHSPLRIHGALLSILDAARKEGGHLYCETEPLVQSACKLLNEKIPQPEEQLSPEEIHAVLQEKILHGEMVSTAGKVYLTSCFVQEDETAMHIAKILAVQPEEVDITEALTHIREKLGISLSQRQSEAVYMAFRSNFSIITGSPGTGKTTVLRAIIEVFRHLYPEKGIMLAAPTGRASRRMAESTGYNQAKTLHSLLGLLGDGTSFPYAEKVPLPTNLLIVDESSMIDMWLASKLFARIKPGTKVVMVGDYDQLQSVGAGDVFRELIGCGQIPVTRLNEIFRQKKGSLIAQNAKSINENQVRLQYGEDFVFLKAATQEDATERIREAFNSEVQKNSIEQVQILSPYRSEGSASVEQLNLMLREMVNPPSEATLDLKVGSRYFRTGDKIMQNKNNNKASNGDIGYIRRITRNEFSSTEVTIDFGNGRTVVYTAEEMGHIEHAYATTIHKSMGSEYGVVIIPLIRAHAMMLKRNLLYTAITRAKQKVILVGEYGMLYMAIGRNDAGKRNTMLGERITNFFHAFAVKESELKKAG